MPSDVFLRSHRLLTPADFRRVMDNPALRASQPGFLLLASENGLPEARIGFVLPKRRVRLAVARNRVKRIIRESFRRRQALLAGLDIVFMARDGLDRIDNPDLRARLEQQFQYLARKRQRTAQPPSADAPDTTPHS